MGLVLLPNGFCLLSTSLKIGIYLSPPSQVIGNDQIYISQIKRRILMRYLFCRGTVQKSRDDGVQSHSSFSHMDDAISICH